MGENKVEQLREKNRAAEAGGGAERVARQHADGKMTARERVDFLLDDGTFEEFDRLKTHRCTDFGLARQQYPGDGFVTGHGLVDGRQVFVFAQDFTVFGGSLSESTRRRSSSSWTSPSRSARRSSAHDSGGRGFRKGHVARRYADIFLRNTLASGVVPRFRRSWAGAGGAVYSPAITDFTSWSRTRATVHHRPDVIKR